MDKFTLGILVEDQPGVLSRVTGLFSRTGLNIESLAVGVTEKPGISRITIYAAGDAQTRERITDELRKLLCVRKVVVLPPEKSVSRELIMVKVAAEVTAREAISRIVEIFRARIVDVTPSSMTIEMTGEGEKIAALVMMLSDFNILETARTGFITITRGPDTLAETAEER